MAKNVTIAAYAKINVVLNVLGKLDSGMHELDMVMTPLKLHDLLTFTLNDTEEFVLQSTVDLGPIEDNLIYRAVQLMRSVYKIRLGVTVTLEKNIPISAGLAGGSSDCAATLLGLNELFSLGKSKKELEALAIKLGSDVPYCLYHQTARVAGIGDKVEIISPLPKFHVFLVKPHYGISTKYAYEHLGVNYSLKKGHVKKMVDAIERKDKEAILQLMANSFETSAFEQHPDLFEIKTMCQMATPGVILSGSGPTICMLYQEKKITDLMLTLFKTRDVTIIQTETK